MSDNYRYYGEKVVQNRSRRASGPLAAQLAEILETVRWCEAMWALEARIDRAEKKDDRRDR